MVSLKLQPFKGQKVREGWEGRESLRFLPHSSPYFLLLSHPKRGSGGGFISLHFHYLLAPVTVRLMHLIQAVSHRQHRSLACSSDSCHWPACDRWRSVGCSRFGYGAYASLLNKCSAQIISDYWKNLKREVAKVCNIDRILFLKLRCAIEERRVLSFFPIEMKGIE